MSENERNAESAVEKARSEDSTESVENKKYRAWLRGIVSALIVFTSLYLLQRLLVPKYVDDVVEGAFIAEYYGEEKDFDVIFIGD